MKTENQAKQEILKSDWSVKGVRFMKGHDADSMECSLYYKGKRVATVWDDSWGGGFQYTWVKPLEKQFDGFAKQFTVPSEYSDDGLQYNADIVVDVLVNDFEEIKQIKKICRGKTLFLLNNSDDYWSIKVPFDSKVKTHLIKKYGSKLKEIVNERFV